ncbi:NUDIX domain-containing protein [Nocardioides cynanchi]|uniref:NUDIX domain-containing protein n=1 Tax=Nocardioides cynanchi TaxID=2558918 RepID=UPI00192DB7A2|nr:NUDIX hydrolase [Nocardioides cynanchi]
MRRIAAVVLVDSRGRLLLQERDEGAPVDPDRWGMVGGGIDEGEDDAAGARRELEEETGLTGIDLDRVGDFTFYCAGCAESHDVVLFTAFTDLSDADVECHEGRQIVFVDPMTVHTLDWNRALAVALPRVIGSPSYVQRFGRREPRAFACVILVDAEGRLLLQERDEHAPIDPETWGMPGGHLDPGEDPEAGALRELREETGIRLPPGTLRLFTELAVYHPHYGSVDSNHIYVARVDLTDADVECHEGRQIVFVAPERARGLDLTMSAVLVVPAFLDSEEYRRMCG